MENAAVQSLTSGSCDRPANFANEKARSNLAKQQPGSFNAMLGFLYAVCMIEGADVQLLPASFRAMEVNLGLTPSSLALLALGQALAQWICTPFWGSLADHGYSRKKLLGFGALAWGVLTMCLAFVSAYPVMFFLRVLNGAALGTLSPISQSLLVDSTHPSERGRYFGGVQFAGNTGSVICAVGTTAVSMQLLFGSIQGWRLAFAVVANASIMLAFCIFFFMPEPPRCETYTTLPTFSSEMDKLKRYLRIPTFRVIVLQGLFGCIPWSALSFMIFYFQYLGITDTGAATIFALSMVGGGLGGLLGGVVGDRMAQWSPMHGRAFTAQVSVATGIPLIFIVLACIPRDASYFYTYCIAIFIFGIMASWCGTGVNRPILAEIVDERDRASVFAWLITIDGTFAAVFGAPLVGVLAESLFGYHPSTELISEMNVAQRQINAAALGHALLWCCILPWVLCFICFSWLHVTYGQDMAERNRSDNKGTPSATSALMPGGSAACK